LLLVLFRVAMDTMMDGKVERSKVEVSPSLNYANEHTLAATSTAKCLQSALQHSSLRSKWQTKSQYWSSSTS
jgi:hypothetical protein